MEAEESVRKFDHEMHGQKQQNGIQNLTNDSGYSSDIFLSPEANNTLRWKAVVKPTSTKRSLSSSTPRSDIKATRSLECLLPRCDIIPLNSEDSQITDIDSSIDLASPIKPHPKGVTIKSKSSEDVSTISKQSKPPLSPLTKRPILSRALTSSGPVLRNRKTQNVLVRMLNEADYLVQELLKYLPPRDLLRLSHVNKQLRNIILGHKVSNVRRLAFINNLRQEKEHQGQENFRLKRLTTNGPASSFLPLSPRKAFSEIQNRRRHSPKKQPPSPIPTLSQRFIEEGCKLPQDEELQKCVKCKAPARVQKSALRAICSKATCAYDYCTRCHLPAHRKPQDCPGLKSRPRSSKGGIFSNKCKRSLRRL